MNSIILGSDNKIYDMLDIENLQKHIPAISSFDPSFNNKDNRVSP